MVSTPDDTGPIILGILKNPEPYRGKTFYLASEYVTIAEMAAAYARGQSQRLRLIGNSLPAAPVAFVHRS